MLLSQPAIAGEGGLPKYFVDQTINTIVFVAILIYASRNVIKAGLQARADGISKEINEAKRLYIEAETLLNEYQSLVDQSEAARESMLKQYREQGQSEKEKLIAEGKASAKRIVADAQRAAENELAYMQRKIESELVESALKRAEELIVAKVSRADHNRLNQEYLSEIERQVG
jgi:F-type H+-transporting ATPase subunit b